MNKQDLLQLYRFVRDKTLLLCEPLEIEDYVIQSIEDVSPPKWHLAHTTWFFETFILIPYQPHYRIFHPLFHHLFNSYYYTIGTPYIRLKRGLLSRPTVNDILNYRKYIDESIQIYIENISNEIVNEIKYLILLGVQHEEQHQELLLMDIKHNFSIDPSFPIYNKLPKYENSTPVYTGEFFYEEGGVIEIGHQNATFCFDNELPRHSLILKPFLLASQLITNIEYAEFITEGGYDKPELWLSDGWEWINKNQCRAPLYWHLIENNWHIFTLCGLQEIRENEPVVHISYYEADAYARWRGMRLPLEAEWEYYVASNQINTENGNFLESNRYHPSTCLVQDHSFAHQLFGDVWEWTASPYVPYPGFQSLSGSLGEYNGKFMNNQMVLRGGSCITPSEHIRVSYRNFFSPEKRWPFNGIRLAQNAY